MVKRKGNTNYNICNLVYWIPIQYKYNSNNNYKRSILFELFIQYFVYLYTNIQTRRIYFKKHTFGIY